MLICGIELFVLTVVAMFTERPKKLKFDFSRAGVNPQLSFNFTLQYKWNEEAIQFIGDSLCFQWITLVNVSCVYRKVSQALESIWVETVHCPCGARGRRQVNDSPHMLLNSIPTNKASTWQEPVWPPSKRRTRWMPRQLRLQTPCHGSPRVNQRMNRSTSLFTRREALPAGSTRRWVIKRTISVNHAIISPGQFHSVENYCLRNRN